MPGSEEEKQTSNLISRENVGSGASEQANADATEKPNNDADAAADEVGAQQVDDRMAEEQEKGYRGTVPDKTPNSAYTVQGQKGNK